MNPAQPPEGILDPEKPYWSADRVGEATWLRLKGNLTGRRVEGLSENFTSYVKLGDADADKLIENLKKWGKYPQLNQTDKSGGAYNAEAYQKWLVEEFLEKPFREQVDQKIEDRQAARAIADILNRKAAKQAVELTTDVIEDPWGEATTPPKQYAVVPTTKLLPPAKETEEENKPEAKKKRGSSLAKSITKTFARMETHFQKLSELSEVSEGNVTEISDAFRIQSAALSKGFLDTGTVIAKISQVVDLQTSTMIRIAKSKKDLDQKNLDRQEALNEEAELEEQSSSSGNAQVKDTTSSSRPGAGGGGGGGVVGKVLGGSALANFVAGKGMKKIAGAVASSGVAKKVTEVALRKTLGKEAAEGVAKNIGSEVAEKGLAKGAAKVIGKKIPLIGLGLSAFFAAERAAKGDMLGAALELASGASSTIPGLGTAASVAIDAALIGRDAGVVPFAKGGLTQKSTFSGKRPGVTDLSPDLFKKMYQYELDYEAKNKNKFGKLYADGYEKYFAKPSLPGILGNLLGGVVEFFKNIWNGLRNGLGRGARGLLELFNPRTGTTTNEFKDVLPEGNPQLTSRFGPRAISWGTKNHQGIDIGVDRGSRVTALEDGVVKDIYENFGGHGQAVVIDHADGTRNVYGHVDAIAKVGDTIKKGHVIAKVKYWPGSGAQPSDNTHLHLERRTGTAFKAIDPAQYLNERAAKAKQTPEGKVISSTKINDITFTEREGGKCYINGKEVPKDVYDKEKEKAQMIEDVMGPSWIEVQPNQNLLQQGLKVLSDLIPGRKAGGPVSAGTPYFVGEGGPELFVPKESGFVMNNQKTAGLLDFLPGTGRVMAPTGGNIGFQNKFLGLNIGGRETLPQSRTYREEDVKRYNKLRAQQGTNDRLVKDMFGRHFSYTDSTSPTSPRQPATPSTSKNRYGEEGTNDPLTKTIRGIRDMQFSEKKLRAIEEAQGRPLGNTTYGETQKQLMDQYGRSTYGEQRRLLLGPQSSAQHVEQLVAMAPLEEKIASRFHIISVNNTNTVPVFISLEQSGTPSNAGLKDLHHARMV